jgi:hypothetical protein
VRNYVKVNRLIGEQVNGEIRGPGLADCRFEIADYGMRKTWFACGEPLGSELVAEGLAEP